MFYLIDSHCHLHDPDFFSEEEAEKALARAHEASVGKIICIGTDPKDSLAAKEFAEKHEGVYWTYGIHPSEASSPASTPMHDISKKSNPMNKKISSTTRPVAIGEVGLDYHYENYNRNEQIKLFEQMLQLAVDNNLPVSFHVREAFPDFFGVIANFPKIRGVVHSFSDNKKNLKRILNETEFYIGVNGLATYSTLPLPPLERILLETDAPFLAPIPHRGSKNEPALIPDIANWLATRLELPFEEIAKITTKNTERLFKI